MRTLIEIVTTAGLLHFMVLDPATHRGVIVRNELADLAFVRLEEARSGAINMGFAGYSHEFARDRLEGIVSFLHGEKLHPVTRILSGPELIPWVDDTPPGCVN